MGLYGISTVVIGASLALYITVLPDTCLGRLFNGETRLYLRPLGPTEPYEHDY